MNERELLEMAAKAAGMIPQEFAGNDAFMDGVLERWNPLQDDGDALRLAVSLNIHISPKSEYVEARYFDGAAWNCFREDREASDAATRLAITRAAAQIGKAMP